MYCPTRFMKIQMYLLSISILSFSSRRIDPSTASYVDQIELALRAIRNTVRARASHDPTARQPPTHSSHFTTLANLNIHRWPALLSRCPHVLDFPHNSQARLVTDLSENNMLPIEMRCWPTSDEELAPIRVWSTIRHTQQSRSCMR